MAKRPTTEQPVAAVGYVRVSTTDQCQSVEKQRSDILAWCQANHIPLLDMFVDEGVSGGAALEKRPGLMAALEALHPGAILLAVKRDRIGRDAFNVAMIERLCRKQGATIATVDGVGNGDTPEAEMSRGMLDLFAQYERALIRMRVQSGMNHKRAKQERMSRHLPYGMELHQDGVHMVPCQQEQAVIIKAQSLHQQGLSLRKIASALADDGHLSRAHTPFTAKAIQTMLQG